MADSVTVRFRVGQPYQKAALCVYTDGKLLRRVPKRILTPGEMEQFTLRREELPESVRTVTFQIEEAPVFDTAPEISCIFIVMEIFNTDRLHQEMVLIPFAVAAECRCNAGF